MATLSLRLPDGVKARWQAEARSSGMTLTRWLRGKVDGDVEVLLQDFAVQEVRRAAPEVVERIADEIVREEVMRRLGEQSVSREDFVDFAAEVKSWLQQEVESLRAQLRTQAPSSDDGDVRRERFVDAP